MIGTIWARKKKWIKPGDIKFSILIINNKKIILKNNKKNIEIIKKD